MARLLGAYEMKARLDAILGSLPHKIDAALYAEAEIEMAESKRRVPVDTGVLRGSSFVEEPTTDGRTHSVVMGYGGAASAYAVVVHEDMDAFHPVGEAKFLEGPLRESAPYLADRIARRIELDT